MTKEELSRLVAEYLAKGGDIEVMPEGKPTDAAKAWAMERMKVRHKA